MDAVVDMTTEQLHKVLTIFRVIIKNKDEKTLNILLVHWVNHNQSHEEGFQEWVEKAKAMGKTETAQCIEKAIEYMNKANEMLVEAKKNM